MPLQSNIKAFAFSGSLLLLLSLCTGKLLSQDIQFIPVPQPMEKPWGNIWGITQDTHGYMWFAGADGLYRHDGVHTILFNHDSTNQNSLSQYYCASVHADRDGFIWIGTLGGGLDRFDPATGNFTHYRHNEKDTASLSNDTTLIVFEDSKGFLWVGTSGGLNRLDKKTGKFTRYLHQPNDPGSLSNNIVTSIYEDKQRTLWVGTGNPWTGRNVISKEGGLNRMDKKTGKFKRYLHDPKDPFTLMDNRVGAIFEDSRGTFWVGSSGDGLHTMDRVTGKFERHRYNSSQPQKLSRPSLSSSLPGIDDFIRFINEDASGAIWIGTLLNGINRYDTNTKEITHYDGKQASFHDNSGLFAFNSREGVLWISTWQEKIYRIDPIHTNVSYHNITKAASSIYEDSSGTVWIGYLNGLIRMGPGREVQRRYENDSLGHISKIAQAPAGKIWIATLEWGLVLFDPLTETFSHFQHDPKNPRSLVNNTVWTISEAGDGKLWVGTVGGIDQLDNKTGEFIHFQSDPQDSQSPPIANVFRLLQDTQGRLWGSRWGGGGIFRMEQNGRKFKHFLQGNSIASLLQDADGRIWAGARNGLYRFDSTSDNFEVFNYPQTGEGFKNILFIVEDNEKCLWIYTNLTLFRLSRNRDNIKIYGKNFGIKKNELPNLLDVFKSRKGEIFFADEVSGFYSFVPDRIKSNDLVPQVGFTNLWLGGQSIGSRKERQMDISLAGAKEIRLDHNQNVFSIDYAVLHYSNPEDNQHLFMLENYDNTWRKGSDELRANYFYVPPGRYNFHVKAATHDGVWTENTITIIINPPWWRTWWAFCIYGLLFIAGVLLIHNFQRKRIVKAEREKAKERELLQAREIEKAYHELKTTQAQLIQSEKMASLGELTAGIAHEIQNPLNFVNNFSEVNKELIAEMREEIKKGNYDEVNVLAKDVEDNEEKINHHGKRADAIVKGMLQHSRSSSGIKEATDINALADEYLRLAYHGLRAKDKSFNANMKTDYDQTIGNINIIPQDIGRVILNLITNAFYAVTEKKKQIGDAYRPTVLVSTKRRNGKIEISVQDNGNGISQKVLDKIFQPFFSTKPTGQGTGLGLSLSYDIVKAHGGEIKVKTNESEGSEFVISLPVNH